MPVTPPATHSRASSVSGSFGQSEVRRLGSSSDFDKYAEDDDEDYEDVFGKVNPAGMPPRSLLAAFLIICSTQPSKNRCKLCS